MSYLTLTLGKWEALKNQEIVSVISDSSNLLALALDNGSIWLAEYDNRSSQLVPWTLLAGHHSPVVAMCVARIEIEYIPIRDNILLSCSLDNEVLMWDISDGRCLQKNTCVSESASINFIRMTHSGRYILCGSEEGRIFVLNASTLVLVCEATVSSKGIIAMALLESDDKQNTLLCLLTSDLTLQLVLLKEKQLSFEQLSFWKAGESSAETCYTISVPQSTNLRRFESMTTSSFSNDIILLVFWDVVLVYHLSNRRCNLLLKIPQPSTDKPWKSACFGSQKVLFCSTVSGTTFVFYLGEFGHIKPVLCNGKMDSDAVVLFSDECLALTVPRTTLQEPLQAMKAPVLLTILDAGAKARPNCLSTSVTLLSPDVWASGSCESSNLLVFSNVIDEGKVKTYLELWSLWLSVPCANFAWPSTQSDELRSETNARRKLIPPKKVLECKFSKQTADYGVTATCLVGDAKCAIGLNTGSIYIMLIKSLLVSKPGDFSKDSTEILTRFEHGHSRDCAVTALYYCDETIHERKLLVSGGEDHAVLIWDANSGSLLSRLIGNAAPIVSFVPMPIVPPNFDSSSRLLCRKTICAIASDHSVSLVLLDKTTIALSLPPQAAAITQLAWHSQTTSNSLAVTCRDGNSYIYTLPDGVLEGVKSRGHIHSCLGASVYRYDQILDLQMFDNGPWNSKDYSNSYSSILGLRQQGRRSSLLTFGFNLRSFLKNTLVDKDLLSLLKVLFSCLLAWGIDSEFDKLYEDMLGLSPPPADLIICQRGSAGKISLLVPPDNPSSLWRLSPNFTAQRLLQIVSLAPQVAVACGTTINDPFLNKLANHYGISLPSVIGSGFSFASFSLLAKFYQDSCSDIQVAARAIFRATLIKMPRESKMAIIYYWQPYLPAGSRISKMKRLHSRATLIVGAIGSEDSSLLSSEQRKQVAESLVMLLTDQSALSKRLAAIELIGRAFPIWEAYLNGGAVLRALLSYALTSGSSTMHSGKASDEIPPASSGPSVSSMAKQALMHVAVVNTALFFNTLAFDVSHSRDISERIGCLKLFEYFVNKKPLILFPHVAEMVDSIVRCLDPNIPAMRECLIHNVTTLIYDLVVTFPHVTFHSGYQRLAVGTLEGLVLIFDLKTATRYQILEGHKRPIIAVSFSPDGKLICSYSHEENLVRVWQPNFGFFGALVGKIGNVMSSGLGAPSQLGAPSASEMTRSRRGDSLIITAESLISHDEEPSRVSGSTRQPHSYYDLSIQSIQSFRTFQIGNSNPAPSTDKLASILKHTKFEWISDRCFKLYSENQLNLQFTV